MNSPLHQALLIIATGSVLSGAMCFAAEPAAPAATSPPETSRPVRYFPLGVYWPWERTAASAKSAGMDTWAFAKQTCELLKANGVDSIWLVNIGSRELAPLLKITRPLGLKLIPCLSDVEPRNLRGKGLDPAAPDFKEKALAYYAVRVPEIVQAIGEDREGVLAWALCDEPTGVYFDLMEPMREIFAKADPDRPALAVTMWGQTPGLIATTRFSVFCTDLYPFFGPNDPSGPHTATASRNYYSGKLQPMVTNAGKDGRIGWVMAMCFSDIRGPRTMAPDGMQTALPGAFVHWRPPTLPEMRWQIWEGLRLGVKGEFIFSLLGQTEGKPDAAPPTDPRLQQIVVKKATPVGYAALLDRAGHPTPQFIEMSLLYRKLAPYKALLERLKPAGTQGVTADGGAQTGSFVDGNNGESYVIVVNPDFDSQRIVTVAAPASARGLVDVLTGKNLGPATPRAADANFTATISLKAGDGVLLKIQQ